jgi:hypothetical protein
VVIYSSSNEAAPEGILPSLVPLTHSSSAPGPHNSRKFLPLRWRQDDAQAVVGCNPFLALYFWSRTEQSQYRPGHEALRLISWRRFGFSQRNQHFEPDEEGAAAYTTTLLNGGTFEQAGAAAQQAMQDSVAQDNQTREHPDPMPEVKTRDKEDKSPN